MMFRISAIVMSIVCTIAFPPLALITVPYVLGTVGNTTRRAVKLNRQRNAFIAHQQQVQRDKVLRSYF